LNCGAKSCPPIGVYSSANLESELSIAMKSFGLSNVDLKKENPNLLIFDLSRILLWYREDFYLSNDDIPAMVYFLLFDKDSEERKVIEEFFDVEKDVNAMLKKDSNGLLIWDKKLLKSSLKIKKGSKFKITWKEYDWGTNSK
jgi:hypothetical protein